MVTKVYEDNAGGIIALVYDGEQLVNAVPMLELDIKDSAPQERIVSLLNHYRNDHEDYETWAAENEIEATKEDIAAEIERNGDALIAEHDDANGNTVTLYCDNAGYTGRAYLGLPKEIDW